MVVNPPELEPFFHFVRVSIVSALRGDERVYCSNETLEQYINATNSNITPLLYDFFVKFDYLYALQQANAPLSTEESEESEVLLSAQDLIDEVHLTVM
ncbi:hypothetical protein FCV71_15425 [Vibrio lentus]|uniref:hypothetical protein n=1 Tax=Vibrio lentus TaxID=136468 RepID=UPI0010BCF1D0|nr:hypothetical protein [Vibrio lentus]TKF95747.1 hypothetical protein FCV71_15425 [Vibrio lentus]